MPTEYATAGCASSAGRTLRSSPQPAHAVEAMTYAGTYSPVSRDARSEPLHRLDGTGRV